MFANVLRDIPSAVDSGSLRKSSPAERDSNQSSASSSGTALHTKFADVIKDVTASLDISSATSLSGSSLHSESEGSLQFLRNTKFGEMSNDVLEVCECGVRMFVFVF